MSFLDTIKSITPTTNTVKEDDKKKLSDREEKLKLRQESVRTEKFKYYNQKYIKSIMVGIENAAKRGENVKYINFDRNDFKANCYGLGNPSEFQLEWFNELCNPDSKYLEEEIDGKKVSFQGFTFEQIPNNKFTTKISW